MTTHTNNFIIPRPVSEQLPSAFDLARDKVFLEDFHNGFLSRGVTTPTLMAVRQQRQGLMSTIHTLLNDFVRGCHKKHVQQLQKNGMDNNNDCCWADVRPYGSFAIGTDLLDSDIDLYVQQTIFFFLQKNKSSSGQKKKKKKVLSSLRDLKQEIGQK